MIDHFTINKRLISGVLTKYKTTFDAFCELITNAIHAGSRRIEITLESSDLLGETADVGFKRVVIKDDGSGVSKSEFKTKILDIATESRKAQGGKGVGRFAALQLGSRIEIETLARDPLDQKLYRTLLVVDTKDWNSGPALDKIPLEVDYTEVSEPSGSYYQVVISDFYPPEVTKNERHLRMVRCFASPELERAVFERYTDVIIRGRTQFIVNGHTIRAEEHIIGEIETSEGEFVSQDGDRYPLAFHYMQLAAHGHRHKILLRVVNGDISTVAHAFDYSGDVPAEHQWVVFVDSPYFGADTDACRNLFMSELNPDTEIIGTAIKNCVDTFFQEKYEAYYDFASKLKNDVAYPYREKKASSLTRASVFNQLAYCIEEKHHLLKSKSELRKLVYRLVDRSLNLPEFNDLIGEVLKVSDGMVSRFNAVLRQVDLEDVVVFCDEVKAKEQFLDFLHQLNYGDVSKYVGERSQLHKIVQRRLWIFGEEYNDSPVLFSDKNLRKNLENLRSEFFDYEPSEADDNLDPSVSGPMLEITDLFFFNEKLLQADDKEIMIVELKAPRVRLGQKELTQAKRYAMKLQTAGVFPDGIKYKIVLIGSDVCPILRADYGQIDSKRPTLVHRSNPPKQVEIWAAKWSDLIEENRRKLSYLGEHLATKDREVQEYWMAEFGDVPTKELFSKMQEADRPKKQSGKGVPA